MPAKVKVIQKKDEEIPTEVIAQSIEDICDGMKQIMAGRLNERAIVYLLQKSSGVGQHEIKAVLNSLKTLKQDYLKDSTKK